MPLGSGYPKKIRSEGPSALLTRKDRKHWNDWREKGLYVSQGV